MVSVPKPSSAEIKERASAMLIETARRSCHLLKTRGAPQAAAPRKATKSPASRSGCRGEPAIASRTWNFCSAASAAASALNAMSSTWLTRTGPTAILERSSTLRRAAATAPLRPGVVARVSATPSPLRCTGGLMVITAITLGCIASVLALAGDSSSFLKLKRTFEGFPPESSTTMSSRLRPFAPTVVKTASLIAPSTSAITCPLLGRIRRS
mmetsp:Transcript_13483/g.40215  ORF Transcript_13483/g.40215 Transcript_13483/m.40215 type:complete len:211 (-) Transcript_13483:990-1622(-)